MSESEVKTSRRSSSIMWQLFDKVNNSVARCCMCSHKVSYKSTTSNLKRHYVRCHPFVDLSNPSDVQYSRSVSQLMGESEDPRENLKEFIAIDASGEHGIVEGDSDGGEGEEGREGEDGDGTPPKKIMKKTSLLTQTKIKPEVISSNGVDYLIYTSDQPSRRTAPPTLVKTRNTNIPMRTAASVTVERPIAPSSLSAASTTVGRPGVITEPEDEFSFFARFLAKRIRSFKDPYWQSCAINEINIAMHKVEMRRYEPPKGATFGSTTSAQTEPLTDPLTLENQVVEEIVSQDEIVCETQVE